MNKAMTIFYKVGNGLYINLTNKCPCACTFCIRQNGDHVYDETDSLWLSHEPSFEEVKAAFDMLNCGDYTEAVFCGYGEPTEALGLLLKTAGYIKSRSALKVRINTNGLGNLINGRRIEKDFEGLIDTVSVSLNSSDAGIYQKTVRPTFGAEAWPAMCDFAKECRKYVPNVVMTTVSSKISPSDEKNCADLCKALGVRYRIREYQKK